MTMSLPAEHDSSLLRIADVIGGLMEFWGFKRAMGRMWAILYLTPEPLSAQELGERLHMSSGAVSMTLQELSKWGVVKKAWRPGERRDYYAPETSIWKMVSRVFRERELALIRSAIETFEEVRREVVSASRTAASEQKKRLRFVIDRIDSLLNLARLGEMILSALLAGQKVDPTPIARFFESKE